MANPNRDKGLAFERAVARYFRLHGLCGAERSVSTGWRVNGRSLPDTGDLKGIPGITVQCKCLAQPLTGKALEDAMSEANTQRIAAGAPIGTLIEKRQRISDIGRSWAWLPTNQFVRVNIGADISFSTTPVRTELRHIIAYLVIFSKGYRA